MINMDQVMKTYRKQAQWLELFQQRSNFKVTNIDFANKIMSRLPLIINRVPYWLRSQSPTQQTLNAIDQSLLSSFSL